MMNYPQRKHPRLDNYDYSLPGYYYVTIHSTGQESPFSKVIPGNTFQRAQIQLSPAGICIQEQLLALENRYHHLKVEKYVIMPTHIHAIFRFFGEETGSRAREGLTDVLCTYKSLATRQLNQCYRTPGRKWFQTSFYERVLRSEHSYQECWKYIDENPEKWLLHPDSPEQEPEF